MDIRYDPSRQRCLVRVEFDGVVVTEYELSEISTSLAAVIYLASLMIGWESRSVWDG